MSAFITALTRELHAWQDDTQFITYPDVLEMLTRAAQLLPGQPVEDIKLSYEVEPEDLICFTVLTIGDDSSLLLPVDVASLRALLLSWDEQRPAQVGDPLTIPTRLPSGVVISVVTQELLDLEREGE